VGLIARQAEQAGIPTLCMGSAYDIMAAVNPPRAAFLDFPLGYTTGKPHQPQLQQEILTEALRAFASLDEPGSIQTLPFVWDEEQSWKNEVFRQDIRMDRYATPQYQSEEDRQRAEANDHSALSLCGCEACTRPGG
jgi:hypothetical protein